MNASRNVLKVVTVFLGLLSCNSPTSVAWDGAPLLRTEGTEYQLISTLAGAEVAIPYSYENLTGSRVSLSNCKGGVSPSLEKKTVDGWIAAWSPVRLMCLSPPIRIKQGTQYHDTLRVFSAPFGSNARPQFFFGDIEGTYRLRWDIAYAGRDSDPQPLSLEFRVSNEFLLKEP